MGLLKWCAKPGNSLNAGALERGLTVYTYRFKKWFKIAVFPPFPIAISWHQFKQDAGVPLKDETHGGEDVAILAKGPHAHLFAGVLQQK